jgi:hypothetical protein
MNIDELHVSCVWTISHTDLWLALAWLRAHRHRDIFPYIHMFPDCDTFPGYDSAVEYSVCTDFVYRPRIRAIKLKKRFKKIFQG